MVRERFQNPRVGDDLRLRLLVYNGSVPTDVQSVNRVEIWKLDDLDPDDVDKRVLIETIAGGSVTHDSTGRYSIEFDLEDSVYCVGNYVDLWYLSFEEHEADQCQIATIAQKFSIARDIWFTSPSPVIFDFTFSFRPNRLRQGSKQYLIVNVKPNTPTATDMEAYYRNMISVSPLRITIIQRCGECLPAEEDLRTVVEDAIVEFREMCLGYYFLDTTEMSCGIYDVSFKLELAENVYISPTGQLEIY